MNKARHMGASVGVRHVETMAGFARPDGTSLRWPPAFHGAGILIALAVASLFGAAGIAASLQHLGG